MITVTTNALHQIKKLITSRENIPAGIKVGINTKGCSGLSYTLEYVDKIDIKDERTSYQLPYFQIPTKQDDLIITPSCVTHEVPPFESDELRVTIVTNLSIK